MHSELSGATARWYGFTDSTHFSDLNHPLYLFLVDVVDCIVCNDKRTLLRPVVHVDFLDRISINKSI